jgi:hypothetical protein
MPTLMGEGAVGLLLAMPGSSSTMTELLHCTTVSLLSSTQHNRQVCAQDTHSKFVQFLVRFLRMAWTAMDRASRSCSPWVMLGS